MDDLCGVFGERDIAFRDFFAVFVVVFGIKEDPVKRMKTVLFESIEAFGEIAERFECVGDLFLALA